MSRRPVKPKSTKRHARLDDGVELHLKVWGPQVVTSPAVVLVHGFMGSAEAWGDLPARLAANRRVIVPDLLGHGQSTPCTDPERYAIPRMAASLGRAVAEVAPGPADWVGYSMGGRIVLAGVAEGALDARSIVLESSSPGLATAAEREQRRALDDARAAQLESAGLDAFIDRWLAQPLFESQQRLLPAVRARERTRRRMHQARALAACLRGGGTGRQASYWPALGGIDVPTLLITGVLDAKFDAIAGAMAARLPRVRRCRVEAAGHAVHLEAPGPWLAAVAEAVYS